MSGTLYGVGVGPGDPELMTVKAWRLISMARVIAYLAANGGESTARAIAQPFMPEDVTEIAVDVPMRTEPELAQAAYDSGARRIAEELEKGEDVVVLCEGDPLFYGSFIYLFERLGEKFTTEIVPGVTSFTAAAAAARMPLARRSDVVKVLPATLGDDVLGKELAQTNVAAIIKVGRHFARIKTLLETHGLARRAVVVEKASQREQRIRAVTEIAEAELPYFTTILVQRADNA